MSDFLPLILAHLWSVLAFGICLLFLAFAIWSRLTKSLLGRDFWVIFPLIGKMSGWRQRTEGTGEHVEGGYSKPDASYIERNLVVPAERALYNYYSEDVARTLDKLKFDNYREFLVLSHQNDCKPLSFFLKSVLAGLTVAEALGTGFLLAPLLSQSVTPTIAAWGGFAIAIVIASVALWFTHGAGHEMFQNELRKKVRTSYGNNSGFTKRGNTEKLVVVPIGPDANQKKDEDHEPMARLAARLNLTTTVAMQPKRLWLILTACFIVAFCLGTTGYRHYLLNQEQDIAASGMSSDSSAPDYQSMFSGSSSTSNGSLPLPDAVANASAQSSKHKQDAINGDRSAANMVGVILLGFIYLFTQLLGVLAGYKYSFFNEDGQKIYHETRGEISFASFQSHWVHPIAQRAEMRLGQLRSKLTQINPAYRDKLKPFNFMEAWADEAHRDRLRQNATRSEVVAPVEQISTAKVIEAAPLTGVETSVNRTVRPTDKIASAPSLAVFDTIAADILVLPPHARAGKFFDIMREHQVAANESNEAEVIAAISRLKASNSKPRISQALLNAIEEE